MVMETAQLLLARLVRPVAVPAMPRVKRLPGLIQRLKVDHEDPPTPLQHAPDLADGLPQIAGRQVVQDQAADHQVQAGIGTGQLRDRRDVVVDRQRRPNASAQAPLPLPRSSTDSPGATSARSAAKARNARAVPPIQRLKFAS